MLTFFSINIYNADKSFKNIYSSLPPLFQVPVFLFINSFYTLESIRFSGRSNLLELQLWVNYIPLLRYSIPSVLAAHLKCRPQPLQILCIPILFAYPYMTYISEPGLSIILNIASAIKNNLAVSIFFIRDIFFWMSRMLSHNLGFHRFCFPFEEVGISYLLAVLKLILF
jgi:hypothetical protein